MCGIFAVAHETDAIPLVTQGLKNLEYRGYDSAGIAFLSGDEILTIKDTGSPTEINASGMWNETTPASSCIGHTRWATNGKVSIENAHPHMSHKGRVAVVHNGIFENANDFKYSYLSPSDYQSDTDTEVIANIIEQCYDERDNPLDGLYDMLNISLGKMAIVCLFDNGQVACVTRVFH